MIHDVDASLAALIRAEALAGGEAEVVFDPPTKEWASRRHAPAVDVFLYDIREDVTRRDISVNVIRDADGNIIDRRPPPRRFQLSYLLTAWTRRTEDEHRLLSQLLTAFVRHDRIPDAHLNGQLAEQGLPVILKLALPLSEHRSISDLWTALGGEMKPSLDLVVVAPLDPRRSYLAGPPVEDGVRIHLGGSNGLGGSEER
jgi:Pvc16 N-terminal domain